MFPFLKRDDCPVKFKILVSDKMISYNTVLKNRQLIIEDAKSPFLDDSERLELAKSTVENFENDQLLFDELIHYHETGEVLGNHPMFKKERFEQQVKAMSGVEAFKAYKNLAPRISREKKKLKSAKDQDKKNSIKKVLQELELQRKLLKQKIDG